MIILFSMYYQYVFELSSFTNVGILLCHRGLCNFSLFCSLYSERIKNKNQTGKPSMSSVRDRMVYGRPCKCLAKSGAPDIVTELNQVPNSPLSLLTTLPITCYFRKPALFAWLHPELPLGQNTQKIHLCLL